MDTKVLKALPLALLLASSATAVLAAGREPSEKKEKSVTIADDGVVLSDGDEPFVFRFSDRARGGRLGVRLLEMTPELRAHYGAPRDAGVLVAGVEKDSPAAKAGIQVGDIITRAGGDPVESALDLSRALRQAKAGDTLKLDLSRDRASRQMTVKIEERGDAEWDLGDVGRGLERDLGRHFGQDLERDIRREIGRHAWVFRDPPVIRERHVYRDLPEIRDRLQKKMEELEKRLRDLEKRLPSH